MPGVIDPGTINVDVLPGVWTALQGELTEEERHTELEAQATASLVWSIDVPKAILRLLLSETGIERAFEPPEGYDPELQGDWIDELVAFKFKRPIHLDDLERDHDKMTVAYNFGVLGYWCIEIEPEKVTIERM